MVEERPWHALSVEDTFAALESSPEGLTTAEVARRLEEYGPNELEQEQQASALALLLHQLRNPLVIVLAVAAVVSFLAGKTIDAIVIVIIIIINSLIGFYQENRAARAVAALRSQAAPEAEVIRRPDGDEGEETSIKEEEVVPGDVIVLSAGARVPADARLFEAVNLAVDEAMLTGESVPAAKTVEPVAEDTLVADRTSTVYGGSIVTEGRGQAVVFATGKRTEIGEIATLIEETEKAESPLQRQTFELGKKLGLLALGVAILILIVGFLRGYPLQELFLFVVAAAVSSIPEGLPAVMSITLAVGVNRMARRQAIIRRLAAVDTLGAATAICTDKTGTLTTNQMTVQQIFTGGRTIHVTGGGFTPEGQFKLEGEEIDATADDDLRLALHIATLCNDAQLIENEEETEARWEIRGDPTEGALVVAARKAGMAQDELEEKFPRLDEIPFSADYKYMATFHETPEGEARIYLKGAPDVALELCSQFLEAGEHRELDQANREAIQQANDDMAAAALRVLAVAYKPIAAADIESCKEALEVGDKELVFVGLLGMMDPPRPEVEEAIGLCRRAGIKVMMVTGDHQTTGEAVARDVGILNGGRVLAGADLEPMADDELDELIEETAVFARVTPAHKQRIVQSLQRHGHVVAMTGDGVNDAPALKRAEIGVAMGITGTDVTKETADMVLTDDNFASIVSAVEEGRVVFANVQKVVKFLIATNVGEILTILGALVLLPVGQLIFTPIQILWVNLVTDGLLDITIALEPKEGDVMDQPPRHRNESIITRDILLNVIFVAIFMAVGTLWIFNRASNGDLIYAQTMAFTTMAMFQVFNALNVRSRSQSVFQLGLFSNKYLIGAIILSVLLLVLANQLLLLQIALSTTPLAWQDWLPIVLVASTIFIAQEIRKFIAQRMAG